MRKEIKDSITVSIFHHCHKKGNILAKRFNTNTKIGKAHLTKTQSYCKRHSLPFVAQKGWVEINTKIVTRLEGKHSEAMNALENQKIESDYLKENTLAK